MQEHGSIPFSELTTLRLGGPPRELIDAEGDNQVREALAAADGPVLLVSGGSNLVVADEGFDGTAIRIATRGVTLEGTDGHIRVEVAAGEPWDEVVARCIEEGLAGVECLSGIPGSTGATPIQNVGAYGEEVSSTISGVTVLDRRELTTHRLAPQECGFSYRSSAFKRSDRHVVLGVTFELERDVRALPIRYAELARTLGVELGARPPLADVREAVLSLRRRKGMVVAADDPDSVSAGSFFINPVISTQEFEQLKQRADAGTEPPGWPEPNGQVKTSAAWLIEQAGFHRGYGNGNVGVSTKHTLALINRGNGTTTELIALARELRDGVQERFGVTLHPEPTLVGVAL